MQSIQAALDKAQQAQHRAGLEHEHALAALEAQLKTAAGEMQVLRAGAGHAKDQALATLTVSNQH